MMPREQRGDANAAPGIPRIKSGVSPGYDQ